MFMGRLRAIKKDSRVPYIHVMPDRSHKVVVITGAASGLGRTLALEFLDRGFQLALLDISQRGLEDLLPNISGKGVRVTIHQTDISKEENVAEARLGILRQHGRVDLLVNNAGVSISQLFEEMANADFRALFEINFWGTVYCTRHFLPDLRNAGEGHIVNIVSGFAMMGFPGKTAYAASKGAITAFTHSLKTELSGSNVRISLVIPPPLNTNIVAAGKHGSEEKRAAEAAFLAENGMPLAKAASLIAAQVLKGTYRIVVGRKTRLADLAARLFPTALHHLIGKYKRRFPFA
jgi:short-subunit dehydrogenase